MQPLGEFRFGRVRHPDRMTDRFSSEIREVLPEVGKMFIRHWMSDVRHPIFLGSDRPIESEFAYWQPEWTAGNENILTHTVLQVSKAKSRPRGKHSCLLTACLQFPDHLAVENCTTLHAIQLFMDHAILWMKLWMPGCLPWWRSSEEQSAQPMITPCGAVVLPFSRFYGEETRSNF